MNEITNIILEESWKSLLSEEFTKPYFAAIKQFILSEKGKGKRIFPTGSLIFNAFQLTPFKNVKVVIIGQDPYHGSGQAHGLCFSVQYGVKPPPSLVNIYQEMKADVGLNAPNHGNLEAWGKQGVLLLNAVLTVNESEPASHKAAGWETFTDAVIRKISDEKTNVVFILWGKFAQQKESLIDASKHLILKAAHPSPFSAYNGFFGSKPFSKTNEYLSSKGLQTIDWTLNHKTAL